MLMTTERVALMGLPLLERNCCKYCGISGVIKTDLSVDLRQPSKKSLGVLTAKTYFVKAQPGSGCAVETKVIGQYSPQHSDWHVQCGPKSRLNLRMNDVKVRRDLSIGAPTIICGGTWEQCDVEKDWEAC